MIRRLGRRRFPHPRDAGEDANARCSADLSALTPELRHRIDEAAVRSFGAPIEEIVPPGELRDLLYNIFIKAVQQKPRPIPPETLAFVERCRANGMVVTPGAGPRYLRGPLQIGDPNGSLLTDAILEERYGCE
jgi:hypothetical protein